MKWKIFKLLFKRELGNVILYRELVERSAEMQVREKRYEMEIMKKQYGLIERIYSIDPKVKIVGIETNKRGERLIVTEQIDESSISITLYGASYQGITQLPRLMATIIKDYDLNYPHPFVNRHVHIDDILMKDDNIGNGSIAMKYFLETINTLNTCCGVNIVYINGGLSSEDRDHFDRLEHYYRKFNFDVSFNKERTSGRIKMNLQ